MNLLDRFTVERLEELINDKRICVEGWVGDLAEIALAAKQANPDFEVWLKENFTSTHRMAFEYEPQDEDDEEMVNHFKASVIDMRTGWDAAMKSNYPEIPEGWVLLPKEITDSIAEAIAYQAHCCGGVALDIYEAILAAAPKQEAK